MKNLYALSFFFVPFLVFWGLCWASDHWDKWERQRHTESWLDGGDDEREHKWQERMEAESGWGI